MEHFLNNSLSIFSNSGVMSKESLLKIIFIYFHTNSEEEKILAKMILSKINEKTKILNDDIDINTSYEFLLSRTLQKTFKGDLVI